MLLFGLLEQGVETLIIFAIIIGLAFAYHEFGHAIVADKLGDPTPRRHGRITLNPIKHLNLAGYVMVLLFGFGGAFTPVTPGLLRGNKRISHALVAVAGPLANLLMAALFAIPLNLYQMGTIGDMHYLLVSFLNWGVRLNIFLMVFNLMPIPPLDGFTIVQGFMPEPMARSLDGLRQYGMLGFVAVFFLLPNIGIDVFGDYLYPTINSIEQFLLGGLLW